MKTSKSRISKTVLLAMIASASALLTIGVHAQDQTRDQVRIYGSQLMTQPEMSAYQNKMRTLKTSKEKEAYRLEHHALMQQRAIEKGMTLPESPTGPGPASQGTSAGGQGNPVGGGAKGKGPAGK